MISRTMANAMKEDAYISKAQRSELLKYNHKDLGGVKPFKYTPLPSKKKTIRLLRLKAGVTQNPHIDCELFIVEFDSKHIPREIVDGQVEAGRMSSDEEADSDSSDIEERLSSDSDCDELDNETRSSRQNGRYKGIQYEALSWCWGVDAPDYALSIRRGGRAYRRPVSKELALALKYLRYSYKDRVMWIDALCINQDDHEERNHQVQMMSLIYTRAQKVCIWLGEDTPESTLAIKFIRDEIMKLEKFDTVCSKKENAEKWQALLMLMQRPWFSRRWVVQEIALARDATVHCGPDNIPWKDFAVAVELFVEVETATHRLSEVMQKDPRFFHVPGWFEYVSELGASLLVSAAGKIFRQDKLPNKSNMKDLISRRGLLSLEYLVSTLFIFESTEPRDAIYSLLAIARDTAPFAEVSSINNDDESLLMSTFSTFMERKPYIVDYARPYVDVCKDFLSFCIERTYKRDPARALDVLCRPWAQVPLEPKSIRVEEKSNKMAKKRTVHVEPHDDDIFKTYLPKWKQKIQTKDKNSADVENAQSERKRFFVDREYWKQQCKGLNGLSCPYGDPGHSLEEHPIPGILSRYFPKRQRADDTSNGADEQKNQARAPERPQKEMRIPSWVAKIDGAPYELFSHPGMHIMKMGRKNADPLVGLPQDGYRNYSAAQTKEVDMKTLKFKKRPMMKHYSLYVKGFVLGEVKVTTPPSQGGAIPVAWTKVGGWDDAANEESEPPPEFWRTLVADRGKDNRNPPYYYAKACRESVSKGGLRSGSVNTTALINNERNSIIAEFCRRVQAVIWNRSMFKTTDGTLGLAGGDVHADDLLCIIYGCTVPVILRKFKKVDGDRENEEIEDRIEIFKALFRSCETACARKVKYSLRHREPKTATYLRQVTKGINARIRQWSKDREATEKKRKAETELLRRGKRTKTGLPSVKDIEEASFEHTPAREGTVVSEQHQQAESPGRITDEEEDDNTAQVDSRHDEGAETDERLSKDATAKDDADSYYVLLGESYLHGMMDGEAITKQFSEGLPERVFEIR